MAQCQEQEGHYLVSEGLGGRHADLVAAGQRKIPLAFVHEGGAKDVDQAEDAHPLLPCYRNGVEHVFRFPALADEDPHVLRPHRWPVLRDELRGQDRAGRPAGQAGQVDRSQQAGVITGAAADQVEVACCGHALNHLRDVGSCLHEMNQFSHHLRLLVDLLQHEVGVASLLVRFHALGGDLYLSLDGRAVFHSP